MRTVVSRRVQKGKKCSFAPIIGATAEELNGLIALLSLNQITHDHSPGPIGRFSVCLVLCLLCENTSTDSLCLLVYGAALTGVTPRAVDIRVLFKPPSEPPRHTHIRELSTEAEIWGQESWLSLVILAETTQFTTTTAAPTTTTADRAQHPHKATRYFYHISAEN